MLDLQHEVAEQDFYKHLGQETRISGLARMKMRSGTAFARGGEAPWQYVCRIGPMLFALFCTAHSVRGESVWGSENRDFQGGGLLASNGAGKL